MTDPFTELEQQLRRSVRANADNAGRARKSWWRRATLLTFAVGAIGTGATVAATGLVGDPAATPEATEVLAVLRNSAPEAASKDNPLALMTEPTRAGVRKTSSSPSVVPDLDAVHIVVVEGKRFWIAPTVDRRQVCIATDGHSGSGATCAPLNTLAPGQPGVFSTSRPAPGSEKLAQVTGLVPDDLLGVRLHYRGGMTSYHEAQSNVIGVEVEALPVAIEAVRANGKPGVVLPVARTSETVDAAPRPFPAQRIRELAGHSSVRIKHAARSVNKPISSGEM